MSGNVANVKKAKKVAYKAAKGFSALSKEKENTELLQIAPLPLSQDLCSCGSGKVYEDCCERLHTMDDPKVC